MNMLQDCKNKLTQIGQTVRQALKAEAQSCQCHMQQVDSVTTSASTCGCGQDACQIGEGPHACKPRSQSITITEKV